MEIVNCKVCGDEFLKGWSRSYCHQPECKVKGHLLIKKLNYKKRDSHKKILRLRKKERLDQRRKQKILLNARRAKRNQNL